MEKKLIIVYKTKIFYDSLIPWYETIYRFIPFKLLGIYTSYIESREGTFSNVKLMMIEYCSYGIFGCTNCCNSQRHVAVQMLMIDLIISDMIQFHYHSVKWNIIFVHTSAKKKLLKISLNISIWCAPALISFPYYTLCWTKNMIYILIEWKEIEEFNSIQLFINSKRLIYIIK